MSWIKCTDRLPGAGQSVTMKWDDGETTWVGSPLDELPILQRHYWDKLLWRDDDYKAKLEFAEWKEKYDESKFSYQTIWSVVSGIIIGALSYYLINLIA